VKRIHVTIASIAFAVAVVAATSAEWRSLNEPAKARFWFDGVTFELPRYTPELPDRLSTAEIMEIERVARAELTGAFARWPMTFDRDPRAGYQVRVVQDFPQQSGPQRLAAAESLALGPLGSHGWVSFSMLAALAVGHAPPEADRADIVTSIGRGIGRVAAHEFAHQILRGVDLHHAAEPAQYEFASADRVAQFHGAMTWGLAAPLLTDRLSRW
jgi:hypothetical protein